MTLNQENEALESLNNNAEEISCKKDLIESQLVKRRFWMICAGIMLLYSGYNCYLSLQSSIHVENGLGKFK